MYVLKGCNSLFIFFSCLVVVGFYFMVGDFKVRVCEIIMDKEVNVVGVCFCGLINKCEKLLFVVVDVVFVGGVFYIVGVVFVEFVDFFKWLYYMLDFKIW